MQPWPALKHPTPALPSRCPWALRIMVVPGEDVELGGQWRARHRWTANDLSFATVPLAASSVGFETLYEAIRKSRIVSAFPGGSPVTAGSSWPDVSVSAQVVGVSGREARGSLGSGRSAGCAIGEDRTSPCRAIKPGIRADHVPGSAQARAGSPDPSRGTCKSQRRAFTDTRPQRAPPAERHLYVRCSACRGV